MNKFFIYLIKNRWFSVGFLFAQLGAGYFSLHYKAMAIEGLVKIETESAESILVKASLMSLFFVISITAKILIEKTTSYYSVLKFEEAWARLQPKIISRQDSANNGKFFTTLTQLIPRSALIERSIFIGLINSFAIYIFYLVNVIRERFWPGILFLIISLICTFNSGKFLKNQMAMVYTEVEKQRVRILAWIDTYFRSALERQSGWIADEISNRWYLQSGAKYSQSLFRYEFIKFAKTLVGNLLIEGPYYLFMISLLTFSFVYKMSLAQVIVWLGLAEYLLGANNTLADFYNGRNDLKNLKTIISQNIDWITLQTPVHSHLTSEDQTKNSKNTQAKKYEQRRWDFPLKNGTIVRLASKPGLYRISGSNGTGKSTLLQTIMGYNSDLYKWDIANIKAIQSYFKNRFRFIDSNTTVFHDLADLSLQITGPSELKKADRIALIENNFKINLEPHLVAQWIVRFNQLEKKWTSNYLPSSGERIILSLFRLLNSLTPEILLIIADESDAFLDEPTRVLWLETIDWLCKSRAVYLVSHTLTPKIETQSYVSNGFLLGYMSKVSKGEVIDFYISAVSNGSGKVVGLGNIGSKMTDEVRLCLSAWVHSNTKYNYLRTLDYQIFCEQSQFQVTETRSASLSIAVAILNIHLIKNGRSPLLNCACTGKIMPDGSVDQIDHLDVKIAAALNYSKIKNLITFKDVTHLCDLDKLISNIPEKNIESLYPFYLCFGMNRFA